MKKTILYISLAFVAFLYGQTQINWNTQLRNRPNITRVGSNSTWTDNVILTATNTLSNVDTHLYVDGTTYPKTAAGINSALTACTAQGGGTVWLPAGSINITATLTWSGNSCDLKGAGRNNTILQMVDATNNLNGIVPAGSSHVEHLTIRGTGAAGNANGITNGPVPNITINDVEVAGFGSMGINSGNGSTNWIITNNFIHNNLKEGILYGQALGGIIAGNHIYNNTSNGLDCGGSSYITVTNNKFDTNGGSAVPGIDQDCLILFSSTTVGASHNITLSNNVLFNCNTHGIRVQAGAGGVATDIAIYGNTIFTVGVGNGVTKGGAGIIVRNDGTSGQVSRVAITGNTVNGAQGTGAGTGNGSGIVLISSGGAGAFNTFTISSNVSSSNGNFGIELINSNIVDTDVTGNNIINNTSGPFTDTSTRSVWGGNHTQNTNGGFELGLNGTPFTHFAKLSATLSPAQVAANTCAQQVFTVTGVIGGDVIFSVNKPTNQAGLSVNNLINAGTNSLAINFCNVTASPITPTASESYSFIVGQ